MVRQVEKHDFTFKILFARIRGMDVHLVVECLFMSMGAVALAIALPGILRDMAEFVGGFLYLAITPFWFIARIFASLR